MFGRNLCARVKDALEQKVQRIDERFLAAKVEMQRHLHAAGGFNLCAHLAKDIDVRAAKSINRLFAIADDEQIRSRHHSQLRHQIALQSIRVLKLINQEKPVTLGDPPHYFRVIVQQFQGAQLQIAEIHNRETLLLTIQPTVDSADQFSD